MELSFFDNRKIKTQKLKTIEDVLYVGATLVVARLNAGDRKGHPYFFRFQVPYDVIVAFFCAKVNKRLALFPKKDYYIYEVNCKSRTKSEKIPKIRLYQAGSDYSY